MTREEAITILTETQVVYFAPNGKEKVQEALDMAIEALSAEAEWIPCSEKLPDNKTYVLTTIQAIDAVEVVRCKDCRWWSCKDSLHQHNSHLCRYWKSTNTSADDFCSYGERREP